MAHIDYVKMLVETMGDREFGTQEIADLMIDYWNSNRVRLANSERCSKAYSYLCTLAKWGLVEKTRIDRKTEGKGNVAYWRRIHG